MAQIASLVKTLTKGTPSERMVAHMQILSMQEDAIIPLSDIFYAGVDHDTGVKILGVIAEIGGPDALSVLRNVFHFEDKNRYFKTAAAEGLLRNVHNLSPSEIGPLSLFLAGMDDDQ